MIKEYPQIDQASYRLLVENVKDYAIFMIDPDGYIISWNKGAEQIKGYTESEIIGKHFSIFYTKEDFKNRHHEQNLKMAKELGKVEDEGWRVRKDGSVFWANVVFTALKDSRGKLIGFGKVTRDMTRRRKAEEEIKRLNSELRVQLQRSKSEVLDYRHAIDEASIVAITDQKGVIKYVNDNFCKISKYGKEELIGQDHRIINSGYHSKAFFRDLWETITTGKVWRGELKNKAKDGSFYWVDTTIIPFLDENEQPYQYLAIRSDITQRKLAEEQITRINEGLEKKIRERTLELTEALEREKELSELKSRFVSMASHEFRTPLSAILSSVGLVEHYIDPEHDEKRRKHIERIKSSVRNLTDILNNFLSLDKLEQGKVEVKSINFNLHEFMEDIIEEMDGMLQKKKQQIRYMYNGPPEEVLQDKKILRNVLLNLLSNAVKYSPEEKEIYITVDKKGEKVFISIRDEGIGIPLEAQKDMFSKFFRANNTINIQGTGLGLNIVKKYVELLEGDIYFLSKENEGSTFTVEFPARINADSSQVINPDISNI
ncbi:sensor histidine kinase [Segetibacter koreensis]|uniref:sensor histidine kinase n=1 Tax=Segetibacter koreensis TaxID=398037 RepID=UPI000379E9AD|nr:PAS domain-containing sensor histidine kinase [Segetibacter koreensis]